MSFNQMQIYSLHPNFNKIKEWQWNLNSPQIEIPFNTTQSKDNQILTPTINQNQEQVLVNPLMVV